MKQTLIAILPGITIYAVVFLVSQLILNQLRKVSQVLVRFFIDTAAGRELSRQAGNVLKVREADEPRLHARLVRSVTIVTWTRHLSAGTSLFFPVAFVTMFIGATTGTEHVRFLVFITSTVHILLTAISYVLFQRNKRTVMTASEIHEY